jgi:hypothetical protein
VLCFALLCFALLCSALLIRVYLRSSVARVFSSVCGSATYATLNKSHARRPPPMMMMIGSVGMTH